MINAVATPDMRPGMGVLHFSLYAAAGIDMQLVYATLLEANPDVAAPRPSFGGKKMQQSIILNFLS